MSAPVNLTNLREITGGDRDIEQELFSMFITTAEDCLHQLAASYAPEHAEMWRKHAHAFKGISYNLGAEPLGDLCKDAQNKPDDAVADKKTLLSAIQDEFGRVQNFLSDVSASES